jgi:hypothetical protein
MMWWVPNTEAKLHGAHARRAEKPIPERLHEHGQARLGARKQRAKRRKRNARQMFRRSSAAVATSREGHQFP